MKKRKSYPSDLTDPQWELVAPLIPAPRPGGRPRSADMREVVNGILYLDREGCTWRALPHDLPPWRTCYNYMRQWADDGTWDGMVKALRREVRLAKGRKATPSACCIDSQSVKTALGGEQVGTDGGKRVKGRKRHVVTDTLGMLLAVVVTAANVDDGAAAPRVLAELRAEEYPRLRAVFADSKYRNHSLDAYLAKRPRLRLEISGKREGEVGFKPLKVRWVVEQSLGCMGRWRRLGRDYERLTECSEAMVKIGAVHRMLRRVKPARLAHPFRYKRPEPKHAA
jgi:putative transposase